MRYCNRARVSASLCLAILLTLINGVAPSQGATLPGTLPANHPLVQPDLADFHLSGKAAGSASSRIVAVADAPGIQRAFHVEVRQRGANEYDVQLQLALPTVALHKGDVIWMSVQARALSSADESGQGVLGLILEQNRDPYDKVIEQRVSVGPQWTQFAFPAKVSSNLPAGSLHLTLRVGGAAQTLEIADPQLVRFDDPKSITLTDLPQTRLSYGGRESDAPWRAAANARIDQIRKAPFTVRVVDAAGQPIAGASVHIQMQQHAFPFGCVYDPKMIAGPASQTAAARSYREHYARLFNVGVDEVDMKWQAWEQPTDRAIALAAVDWMAAHGIKVRGHCLVWPGWNHLPADLPGLKNDPAALAKRVDDHIRDEVSAFAGRLTEWDVINEPFVNHDLMTVLGDEAMADWFRIAHQADPEPRLMLNETEAPTNPPSDPHYDALYRRVQFIQQHGGPIGGVGMQAHFGSTLTSIGDLGRIYDRFAKLGIPLEITELDINTTDEQLQADYLRDFLTFSFSHPNISGIMMWGFVEGHHWRPDAALWHANWKIKPAGQVWMNLVKRQWWTDATLTSGADGSVSTRGFLGDYTITATAGDKSQSIHMSMAQGGRSIQITLR